MSDNMGRRRGPGGPRMMAGEKAKDFKGSMAKLIRYMSKYKIRFVIMFVFAIAGTVFNIVGPKILGKATTELFNGLVAKIGGTGGIDFTKITQILLFALGLYGIYYDRHFERYDLQPQKGYFKKDQPASAKIL